MYYIHHLKSMNRSPTMLVLCRSFPQVRLMAYARRGRPKERPREIPVAPPKRMNEEVLALTELRLVCNDGKVLGVMPGIRALDIAKERNLHLVEVSSSSTPSVWRLIDPEGSARVHGTSSTEQSSKQTQERDGKKIEKQKKERKVKEVRLNDKCGEHDLQIKIRLVQQFLTTDKMVKIAVANSGRKAGRISRAEALIQQIVTQCSDLATSGGIQGHTDTMIEPGQSILGIVTATLTPKGSS